jgi:GGDEF domain-containing protein
VYARCLLSFAKARGRFKTVHHGNLNVHQNQVEAPVFQSRKCLQAIAGDRHTTAAFFELADGQFLIHGDRGSIFARLKNDLSRAARENTTVSVMICDIDHLKQISDVHGHLVGDEVLQQLSTRLQDLVRPYDGVGRYGGEEFLVVLGGCDAESLRKRALPSPIPRLLLRLRRVRVSGLRSHGNT